MNKVIITKLLLLFLYTLSFSQTTKIKGRIIDFLSREPISFASIIFRNTKIGTVTNDSGFYYIESSKASDTIIIVALGYTSEKRRIIRNAYQVIDAELKSSKTDIEEIVIKPGKNPAHRILKKIIENKKYNNQSNYTNYQYEVYNKLQFDINNIDSSFRHTSYLGNAQFVFNNLDTNLLTGKVSFPLLITETISDMIVGANPHSEVEHIKASRISFEQNEELAQLSGQLSRSFNIYDNYMKFYENDFISPICDFGLSFYRYYLIDSSFIDDSWCYQVRFSPKRNTDRTFQGDFWVADTTFAVKQIKMRLNKNANVNWINELEAEFSYSRTDSNKWCIQREKVFIDFNVSRSKKVLGFFGYKNSYYRNYNFNNKLPVITSLSKIVIDDSALIHDDKYWNANRPYQLSMKEEKIYALVDSFKNLPFYKNMYKLINMLVDAHYDIGWYEIGPYYSLFTNNPIEGNRVRVGGRTNKHFSKKIRFGNYVAYGEKDKNLKYNLSFLWILNKQPSMNLNFLIQKDVEQLGQSSDAITPDNVIITVLRRHPDYKLTLVKKVNLIFNKEWHEGFSNSFSIDARSIFPTSYVPFEYDTTSLNSISLIEFHLKTHFAYKEKFILGTFDKLSLGTNYPSIDFLITIGKCVRTQFDNPYVKLETTISQKLPLGYFGESNLKFISGIIFGKVPYPLLELHKGNETYVYNANAFNLMNYYEFASDKYISLSLEHHFKGLFVNNIPLLKKLKCREVATMKGIIGSINNKNSTFITFPKGLGELKEPYVEGGFGIENILNLFRIDYIFRLTNKQNPDIQKQGFRFSIYFQF